MAAEQLKRDLATSLVDANRVTPVQGLATGDSRLNQFLLWGGLPKGALSLFYGAPGLGATTLWSQTAAPLTQNGRWAAWVSSRDYQLNPWALRAQGVHLEKLLLVSAPKDSEQLLWALQELLSLSLFDLIGCDLGVLTLREHQIVKLKRMAQRQQAAVVLLCPQRFVYKSSFFSLIGRFSRQHLHLERALHRPTPHLLERSFAHADFMPQLATRREGLGRRALSHL